MTVPGDPHPKLRAIFLDAAGTLFHLHEPVGDTYARIAAKHGVAAEPRALEKAFRSAWKAVPSPVHPEGVPPMDDDRSWWHEVVRLTFSHGAAPTNSGAIPQEVFEPMFADMYAHFANADAWQLYEDTLPALELLRAHSHNGPHLRLFVLSNFDRRLHPILSGLGIAHFFEQVLLSSDVGASKPHARMFQAALTAANVAASQCLHLGDDERCDFEGAHAAGMHAFLVARPEVTLLTLAEKVLQDEFPLAPSAKTPT
ncbi:putative hydrolase of the HAD superfamily [Roseimicrobium gellanilyticum]|uniref:Putative hydrolase of the HAD superfamily n=1 Tax=Roseimicrobium gellanilyticum TaxID=748857 RepID=A0A366HU28_9BACT|nr:HAD-IA family hydrolase [Roseimicrobium gellanilyticum]RBP46588.1 putative hydrolase of the HAD superfamily [Roseimicrobium gellanilyticum]